jgi:catechol 2,3-dioxygenase-like lactoylglutathione lyase family enzyme
MKSEIYLEHANITVSDLSKSVAFFQTAFPDFNVRGGNEGQQSKEWLHLGNDSTYLALTQGTSETGYNPYDTKSNGINHLGFVVNNVSALAERLLAAGYERTYPQTDHAARIREYFRDFDGNEFEFIEYLTEDRQLRNTFVD